MIFKKGDKATISGVSPESMEKPEGRYTMDQKTVEECSKLFEETTGRKITEGEKQCIKVTCVKGETYANRKFVDAIKFEAELANKQIQNIRQSINNCQLRFGKVMGCGTCKSLQLCIWVRELCNTVECMKQHIEALQRENEQLQAQAVNDAEVLRKVKDYLDRIYPADVFTGESGDEGALMIVELRKAIDKVLAGIREV